MLGVNAKNFRLTATSTSPNRAVFYAESDAWLEVAKEGVSHMA